MTLLLVLTVFFAVAFVIASVNTSIEDGRERSKVQRSALDPSRVLMHSINPDRCIGCEGCIDACPTNVLALVHHKVQVINYKDCVQCEQCAWACPTTALVMHREGAQPQTLIVPEIDSFFQTSVPGQYLIGEVAGKPLVKNAANLGRLVVEHMVREGLQSASSASDLLDVAIVGSGPGGLSAGLACIQHGLKCVVIEKDHGIASTVSRYPKGKNFMSEPANARNLSFLPVFDGDKEELLGTWKRLINDVGLPIRNGEAVETVTKRPDGTFEIFTTVGSYRAKRVVLATGLRGKPRTLAVPGANLPTVHSSLDDPARYAGQAVLVVGGGDSALEAAMSLVDAGAAVSLSYRGKSFNRAKIANQKRIAQFQEAGRLQIMMASNPVRFEEQSATLTLGDGAVVTLRSQQAFVLIGAEAPVAWLQKLGVRFVERPHRYELGAVDRLVLSLAGDAVDCPPRAEVAAALIRGQTLPVAASKKVAAPPVSGEWSKVRSAVLGIVNHAPTLKKRAKTSVRISARGTTSPPPLRPMLARPKTRPKALAQPNPPPLPKGAKRVGGHRRPGLLQRMRTQREVTQTNFEYQATSRALSHVVSPAAPTEEDTLPQDPFLMASQTFDSALPSEENRCFSKKIYQSSKVVDAFPELEEITLVDTPALSLLALSE